MMYYLKCLFQTKQTTTELLVSRLGCELQQQELQQWLLRGVFLNLLLNSIDEFPIRKISDTLVVTENLERILMLQTLS
jgi:hypothetical protein